METGAAMRVHKRLYTHRRGLRTVNLLHSSIFFLSFLIISLRFFYQNPEILSSQRNLILPSPTPMLLNNQSFRPPSKSVPRP
ncbi:hypothetical protein MIMGU_mgv1a017327mg [Erythranthe guttata]|uniref:Uncharacterized protein n=1 Tax=Erythranthe guttata TaxID=4155 RepID=A0A022RMA2_ERYGU|nr:hypothetical protein MIMGU_mgv1a017327mg [Erythranthe guttata]